MAKKVLTGESYTVARLAGILHESYIAYAGFDATRVTIYGEGYIKHNSITGDVGLLLDDESEYYVSIPEVHRDRAVDVVAGDGWNDVEPMTKDSV